MGELNSNVTVVVGDEPTTSTVPNPRKAHIAGGNAVLFRFNDPAERALASLGLYTKSPTESPAPSPDSSTALTYTWPNIPENGVVDLENVSLYVVDGLLNRDCQVGDVIEVTVGTTTLRTSMTAIQTDVTGENTLLVLKDNLPAVIRAASEVELSLYIVVDGVEVPWLQEETPGGFNYTFDENGVVLADEITMFEASWTDNGVEQALTLNKVNAVFTCEDITDLGLIPGALHPANPLKWGVYAALQNSAGVAVKYTAVANPSDLDDWSDMLDWLGDDKDIYALVPLTHDSDVWDLYETYITTQRAAGHPLCVRVCPSFVDDIVVYEDLDATITEYTADGTNTLVTAEGGQFITDGVSVGDTVDFEFEEDVVIGGRGQNPGLLQPHLPDQLEVLLHRPDPAGDFRIAIAPLQAFPDRLLVLIGVKEELTLLDDPVGPPQLVKQVVNVDDLLDRVRGAGLLAVPEGGAGDGRLLGRVDRDGNPVEGDPGDLGVGEEVPEEFRLLHVLDLELFPGWFPPEVFRGMDGSILFHNIFSR